MDNRYKKLAKNTGIVMIGNVGSKLISFLLLPFYTHYLSPESYGESDIITVYASILISFVTCCIADGIFVFPKNEDKDGKTKYFTSGLFFVVITYVVLAVLLFGIEKLTPDLSGGTLLLDKWWIYLMSMGMFLQTYTQQFAMSIEKMLQYSVTGIVQTLMIAILAIILLPKYGLSGYLWSIILADIIAAVFCFISTKSYEYVSVNHIDKQRLMDLLGYGIPLIPHSIMWFLVSGLNRPIIEKELGLAAIGIFAVSSKFPSVLTMIFQIVSRAMSISVMDEFGKKDFNFFYNRILKILIISVVAIGIVISIFSKPIISVFAAKEFYQAWMYIPILTMAVIFQSMGGFVGNIFMAMKKSKYFLYSSMVGAVVSVILTVLLVKTMGLFGAGIATASSFYVLLLLRIYYAWDSINLFDKSYYSITLFTYITIVVIVSLDFSLFIQIPIIILAFFILYILNRGDIKQLSVLLINRVKK